MLPDAAFTALLLLWGASAVSVLPPADVTVSCNNMKTTVSWKYGEQPQTRFRVYVDGTDLKHYVDNTTDHQYDLSHFVWQSESHLMDYHYITVTANQGENQSEPAKSKSFSFNSLKTPHIKCLLEFPPVELTVGESGATVSFPNPLNFHKELNKVAKQEGVYLKYSILTEPKKQFNASCTVADIHCRHDISFPEGVEKYVTLTGSLCNRDCLGKVEFNQTKRIYPSNSANILVVTLVLMLSILVFVIIVVTVFIYKNVWTKSTVQKEISCLEFDNEEKLPFVLVPSKEDTVRVTLVQPDQRCRLPSCCSGDESPMSSSSSLDCQGCGGGYGDGGLLEDGNQEQEGESSGEDEGNEGYDRGHCPVHIGDGDVFTCYNGR